MEKLGISVDVRPVLIRNEKLPGEICGDAESLGIEEISPATNRPLETWISTVSLLNDNPTVISPAWPARSLSKTRTHYADCALSFFARKASLLWGRA